MTEPPPGLAARLALLVDGPWSGNSSCELCRDVKVQPDPITLANALARVGIWEGCTVSVVARPHPAAVAAVGYLTSEALDYLNTLGWQIRDILPRTRRLGYAEVESLVERLAAKLIEELGEDLLRSARYVPIPRGGMIVLGMLSYALDLDERQLRSTDNGEPLIVIDDIAVSGYRFGEFLGGLTGTDVVFVHLLSHPELRTAIERREQNVISCISADDLNDHGSAHLGEGYTDWKREHEADGRYWMGLPDHVVTPWSEADIGLWNDSTSDARPAIRVAGPTSLRVRWVDHDPLVPVHVQTRFSGSLRPAPEVLFAELDAEVIIGRSDGGPVLRLKGTGRDLWSAILEVDDLETAISDTSDNEDDRANLWRIAEQLTELGILQSPQTQ